MGPGSQGQVAIVRRIYELIAADELEGVLALMDPDFVWEWSPTMPDTGVFRGREAVLAADERWRESWEEFDIELLELREQGNDVVARVRYTATGRGSGVSMNEGRTHVWTLRDGRAIRWRMFSDLDEAERRAGP
jgi:ketosteroid isomerase-like protein